MIGTIVGALFTFAHDYSLVAHKAKIDGKTHIVVDPRELGFVLRYGTALGYLIGQVIIGLIFGLVVAGVISLLRLTFGADFSWTVFLWWGGLSGAWLIHGEVIQLCRWLFMTDKKAERLWAKTCGLQGILASAMVRALGGRREPELPIYNKDKYYERQEAKREALMRERELADAGVDEVVDAEVVE